jgi:hypothetical protein
VDQRHRSKPPGHRPEEGERDGVVSAERQEVVRSAERPAGPLLDLADGLADVERVGHDVAGVGDLLGGERVDIERRMVGAEQPGGLPDGHRAESGAGTVRRAAVEGHADHRHVAPVDLVPAGEPGERGGPGEPGNRQGIERPDGGRLLTFSLPVPAPGQGRAIILPPPAATSRQRLGRGLAGREEDHHRRYERSPTAPSGYRGKPSNSDRMLPSLSLNHAARWPGPAEAIPVSSVFSSGKS